jgi:hypothetical protein
MRVPDAIEPSVGYRVWLVEGNRLHSFAHDHILWEPHVAFEAMCARADEHEVPGPRCTCGVYAAGSFNRLFDMGYTKSTGLFSAPTGKVTVAGQVNLWGGLITGQVGWRAQFAYPKLLLVPYMHWKVAKPLAEAYGVPYRLYNLERKHYRGNRKRV